MLPDEVLHLVHVQEVDPAELMAFVVCRLIPLDKKPGRLIGVGDVPRRIIAKPVLHVLDYDIQLTAGALQTCAGHGAGSEAAIHAMKSIFDDDDTHAALLVDATNAFNLINRQAALHNIYATCYGNVHHCCHPTDQASSSVSARCFSGLVC